MKKNFPSPTKASALVPPLPEGEGCRATRDRVRGKVCLLALIITFASITPSLSAVKFKDVPADHWSAKSVYDLVNLGITQGYPDGTFRGKKNITRYETASFLSKLADKLGTANIDQMKLDITDMKNDIAKMKRVNDNPIEGSVEMLARVANVFAAQGIALGKGPLMDYRLQTSLNNELTQGAKLKINFDTMDLGFNGVTSEALANLLDFTGSIKINPVDIGLSELGPIDLVLTMGPGPIQHTDYTGYIPSDNGFTYVRPYSGVSVASSVLGLGMLGSYTQVAKTDTGQSTTSLLSAGLNYDFQKVPVLSDLLLEAQGDYYFKHPASEGIKDLRGKLMLTANPSKKLTLKGTWGVSHAARNGWMLAGEVAFWDAWNTGTIIKLYGSKIGADYISSKFSTEETFIAGFDQFMRPLQVSTVNLGGEVAQTITNKLLFIGKASFRLAGDFTYGSNSPGSRTTAQAGFAYDIAPQATLNALYRVEQDPTISQTTDLATLGLFYRY